MQWFWQTICGMPDCSLMFPIATIALKWETLADERFDGLFTNLKTASLPAAWLQNYGWWV
jgi:hypothetical protein